MSLLNSCRVGLVVGCLPFSAVADEPYSLFNPVPAGSLRPISADRPDGTESPFTVDAGHLQIETSIVDYSSDDDGRGGDVQVITFFETNAKVGLTRAMDLQFVFAPYVEADDPAATSDAVGVSGLTVRSKINLWGNDGGQTAFGIMPFVNIPAGTQTGGDEVEGGVIAMLGWDVGQTWGLGFQVELDALHDPDDGDHDLHVGHTAVLGFDLVGPWGAYVEYIGNAPTDGSYEAQFSGGVTLGLDDDLVLDVGVRVGLNDAAEDVGVFTGFTWRH